MSVGFWEAGPVFHLRRDGGLPCWILFHPYNQAVWIKSGGARQEVTTRGLVLLRPGTPYEVGLVQQGRNYWEFWANFHPPAEWDPLLQWPEIAPGVMHLEIASATGHRRVIRALRQMCHWGRSATLWSDQLAGNALEQALLICQTMLPGRQQLLDSRVQAVVDFIRGQLHQPHLTVSRLAAAAHVSPTHLRALFHRQLGQSPKRYLELERIRHAQHLLASTLMPIKQVAAASGFANQFHFSARFRRHLGHSPRTYRRQIRG